MKKDTLSIRVTGERENSPLTPDQLDIDEVIKALEQGKNLLFPDPRMRPKIGVSIEEGSVLFQLHTLAAAVSEAKILLEKIANQRSISFLSKKQSQAFYFFRDWAKENLFSISFAPREELPTLVIDEHMILVEEEEDTWVDAELYLIGVVTNSGGKTRSNIHLDTSDYGLSSITIDANREQLAEDDKNRLYKEQELRISIKQNFRTGEYDPKTAKLLGFVDHQDASEDLDDYLDDLIRKATPDWQDIDKDQWLKETRGYEV